MANNVDTDTNTNKLKVSKSRHTMTSITRGHRRTREFLYDIIHQERLNCDLDYLEIAIMHTDIDDHLIPLTFNLMLMLLDHRIMHMYSRAILAWLQEHPLRVINRRNVTVIEPSFASECIRMRCSVKGIDVWSNRRCFAAEDTKKTTGRKERPVPSKLQADTNERYFLPLRTKLPRKRQIQVDCRTCHNKNVEDQLHSKG